MNITNWKRRRKKKWHFIGYFPKQNILYVFGSQNCWFTNWLWTLADGNGWVYFIFALTNIHFKWKSTLLMALGYWHFSHFFSFVSYLHHSQNGRVGNIDVVILYIWIYIFFDDNIGFHYSIWIMYPIRWSSCSVHLVFAKWNQLKVLWHIFNDVHSHKKYVIVTYKQGQHMYKLFENVQRKKKKRK